MNTTLRLIKTGSPGFIAATRSGAPVVVVKALFLLTLLASAPGPAFGAGVQDGVWAGVTGQGRPYELTTRANAIVTLKVGFGAGGCTGFTTVGLGLTIGSSGFFSTSFSSGPNAGQINTSGTFNPATRAASGTVSFSGGSCSASISTTWTAALPPSVPSAPTIGTATGADGAVSVAFTPPGDNGGSAITGYTATCGSQSGNGTTSPIAVTGLTNGTSVTCSVVATNALGNSPPSAASNSVTPAPVPTVTTPTSALIAGTTATLGANVTLDGGATITERGVVFSLTSSNPNPLIGGTTVTKVAVSGAVGLFSSGVTGLQPTSGYSFKGYATNASGTGYSPLATFTTTATVPGAPTIGTATASDGSVSVAFTPPTDNGGSAITGYTATCGTKSASGSASPIVVSGLTNGEAVTCTVLATNAVGGSAPSGASNSVTPGPSGTAIPRLVNISTRGRVETGDNIMIGGFITSGSGPKKVVITGRGPFLADHGVPGTLADPSIRLFAGAVEIAQNDNWQSAANASEITSSGFAPGKPAEAAILTTVNPGVPYTVHLTGVSGTTGVAIVEVFEADRPELPLLNISTRGRVQTGDDVMIGGFIIQGNASLQVLITARGPTLGQAPFNLQGALADPTLELFLAGNATPIAINDNWTESTDATAISATGNAPTNPLESAILRTLAPGAYTAVVRGKNGGIGIGIVEVFKR